jgi:DNA-binding transcriptional LysR family regulator
MDWDDARIFLAAARHGQMLAAARGLGINQATVSRRITALESDLQTKLLVRRTNGCELTDDGRALVASLERIETQFIQAQAGLQRTESAVSGNVRIGAPDGFGVSFAAPRLGELAERHPELAVQLVPVPRSFSLSQREADIAVMVGRPTAGRLVARRLTDYTLGLYAAKDYLKRHGAPKSEAELQRHRLVGYVEDLIYSPALNFASEFSRNWRSSIEISSATGQLEAVRAGAGIGILHDYLARTHAELKPVLPQLSATRAYWMVFHESLRDVARVQAVAAFLADIVRRERKTFVR